MVRLRPLPGKVNRIAVLEYGLMALVLLYSSMWSVFASALSNSFIRLALPVLAVLLLLTLKVVPRRRVQSFCLLLTVLAAYLVGTRYNVGRYLLYYVLPLVLLVLYMGVKDERREPFSLFFTLENIIFALTVYSLVCFVFGTCLGILPGETMVEYHFANEDRTCPTYFHLYYASQTMLMFGREFLRNCGIFAEAPGFSMFLVMGISTELFLRPHFRVWRCLVYMLAAVTTFSTKGILLVLLAVAVRYLITRPREVHLFRVKAVALPVAAVLLLVVAAVLLVDKQNTDSFFIRMDDMTASLKAFSTAPLFGTGYYNDQSIIDCFGYTRPNEGLSMGLTVLLAQGGVFMVGFYVATAVLCVRRFTGLWRLRLAGFFVVYFALLFISNIPFSFLGMAVLAFSLTAGYGHTAAPRLGANIPTAPAVGQSCGEEGEPT